MNSKLFLIYHPESDSLFVADTFVTDGLVEDVGDKPGFIARYLQECDDRKKPRSEQLDGLVEYASAAFRAALDEATRCCLNCEHFIEGPPDRSGEQCGLNNLTPPPSIAARGCPKFMDKVPF